MLEEQTFTIETPEHVEIVYTVAGPGSRLLAFLLDFLVMLVPAILLVLLLIVIASAVAEDALRQVVEGSSDPQDSLFSSTSSCSSSRGTARAPASAGSGSASSWRTASRWAFSPP
jgi:hypothetical protein